MYVSTLRSTDNAAMLLGPRLTPYDPCYTSEVSRCQQYAELTPASASCMKCRRRGAGGNSIGDEVEGIDPGLVRPDG